MEQMISILLIEDDESTCLELKHCIEKTENLKLAAITNNSKEAVELVRYHLPNLVLLDLELHLGGGNGLLFLNELKNMSLSPAPYILVTTHNMSQVTIEQTRQLGADFILSKYETDYSGQYVINMINILREAIHQKNLTTTGEAIISPCDEERAIIHRIQRELELIGINPKATGYKYLIDSILLLTQGENGNLPRILAPKYKKSEKSIERAMQNAIKQAWITTDVDDLLKYYTAKIRVDKGCPTMMEFLCYYANKVERELELN